MGIEAYCSEGVYIALFLPDDPTNSITIHSTQLHLKSVVFVGTTLDEAPLPLFTPDHLVVDKVRVWSVLKTSTSAYGVAIEVYTTKGVDGTLGLTCDPSKSTLSAHHSRIHLLGLHVIADTTLDEATSLLLTAPSPASRSRQGT